MGAKKIKEQTSLQKQLGKDMVYESYQSLLDNNSDGDMSLEEMVEMVVDLYKDEFSKKEILMILFINIPTM